eukprot:6175550-Pleurochrysis_carterae.AAC.5
MAHPLTQHTHFSRRECAFLRHASTRIRIALDAFFARSFRALSQEALRTVGSSAIERRSATQTFSDDEQHRWLDVRVPLQYAVVDSALSLPARSKYSLRGFARLAYHAPDAFGATTGGASASGGVTGAADATTRVRCQLWIRYQLASNVYTICVNDDDSVKLGMM